MAGKRRGTFDLLKKHRQGRRWCSCARVNATRLSRPRQPRPRRHAQRSRRGTGSRNRTHGAGPTRGIGTSPAARSTPNYGDSRASRRRMRSRTEAGVAATRPGSGRQVVCPWDGGRFGGSKQLSPADDPVWWPNRSPSVGWPGELVSRRLGPSLRRRAYPHPAGAGDRGAADTVRTAPMASEQSRRLEPPARRQSYTRSRCQVPSMRSR